MRIASVAALVLLLLLTPVWAEDPPASHLEASTLDNVLYVRAGTSTGTAFLLRYRDRPFLVTARHVVDAQLADPASPIEFHVGGRRGRTIRHTRLLRESRRSDIAVFLFEDDPNVPYFPEGAGLLPSETLHLASSVFLVGYPASLKQTYGSTQLRVVGGWVAGIKKYVPGSTVEYVDIDMPGSEYGHSGGPILLLPDRVVAVAVQRRSGSIHDTIGATYAVPIKYVTALIDDEPVDEDVEALEETLRGTVLVGGLALQGKQDYDIWVQRVHVETGERVWGDAGIYTTNSAARELDYQLVPSDAGSVLVVHTRAYVDRNDADVVAQKLSRHGELLFDRGERSRAIAETPRSERNPVALSDGADGALVVYESHLEGGDVDVLAQRLAPTGMIVWDEAGSVVSSADYPERNPAAVPDGAGGALVALERHLDGGNVDVMAQRIRADGSLAWNEGRQSAVVAASNLPELEPQLVTDGRGGAIVVYQTIVEDGRRYAFAQRVSTHGEVLWNEGERGRLVTDLPLSETAGNVAVAADGLGGAIVALEVHPFSDRPDETDIVVQRLSPEGELQWGATVEGRLRAPVPAASSEWPESRPVLVSDGQGGMVVAFEAGSEQGDSDVLAQRVDGDGRLRWNGGERPSALAFTYHAERRPRAVGRYGDRVLFVFEVTRDDGRGVVGCQALSIATGRALYGGGKLPMAVIDHGDADVHGLLEAR